MIYFCFHVKKFSILNFFIFIWATAFLLSMKIWNGYIEDIMFQPVDVPKCLLAGMLLECSVYEKVCLNLSVLWNASLLQCMEAYVTTSWRYGMLACYSVWRCMFNQAVLQNACLLQCVEMYVPASRCSGMLAYYSVWRCMFQPVSVS